MLTKQTLIDDLATGCKPKDQFRVGLEHEQFTHNIQTGDPLPYDGNPGIKQLLEGIADTYDWEKISEKGNVVALKKDGDNITLEPGGQFEYSGGPKKNTYEAKVAMNEFYGDINTVAEDLGIGFLAKG
ncbi:MAG: glutamate-cysteine ligase family protein, partial [Pseudomonadota bacterium]